MKQQTQNHQTNNNNNTTHHQHQHSHIKLSRAYRIIIFIILTLCQLFLNTSGGLLSSASSTVKETLNFNNKQFGLFGTLYGLGRTTGSIIFMLIIDHVNRKYFLCLAALLKSVFLVGFSFTHNGMILLGLRGLTGIAHWQLGFLTEGMFFVFVFVFVLFTPEKFFSNSLQHIEIESRYSKSKKDRTSSFERISKTLKHNTHKSSQHDSVFTIILQTIQNKIFVFGMIVRGLLMGTNTALHYWLNDYIRNALNINDTKSIFYGYTFVNLLSPIIGIFANSAMTYCFGSYENKNASCGLLVFHAITCLFGVSMLTMDALVPFCLCLLMYFIFSSAALPMIQGILISSVPLHAKGTSFGFSNVFATLFISGPAPVVYGIINDHYKDSSKKMGMVFLMGLCCSGLLFIILLHVFRMESIRKEEKEKEVVLYDADDEEKNYRFEQEMESVENDDE